MISKLGLGVNGVVAATSYWQCSDCLISLNQLKTARSYKISMLLHKMMMMMVMMIIITITKTAIIK